MIMFKIYLQDNFNFHAKFLFQALKELAGAAGFIFSS